MKTLYSRGALQQEIRTFGSTEKTAAAKRPNDRSVLCKGRWLLAIASAAVCQFALGQTCTWIGGNVGTWSTTANWENGRAPQAGDTAVFTNTIEMTSVTLDADVSLDGISIENTRLNVYSATGKAVTFSGSAPTIDVADNAVLRVSGAKLVSAMQVKKSGEGKFITVGNAAQGLKITAQAGRIELEGESHAPLTVTMRDGNWESAAHLLTTGAETDPLAAYGDSADSLLVGHTYAQRSGVTGCRKPVFVGSSFSFTADVEMDGSSAYGFTVAFHNDPRGHLAHMIHHNDYMGTLGYGITASLTDSTKATKIQNSFAFGIYNYFSVDGVVTWGRNGTWEMSATSNPKIYTATRPSGGGTVDIPRQYSVRVDYDSFLKRATLTLTQDQREIVAGGQANVSWSQEVYGVDLAKLCGADEAFLAFTFNEGGRNILATLKNVRLEYVQQEATSTFSVSKNDNRWENQKCYFNTTSYAATGLSPYGSADGSIRVGYNLALYGTVTGCKDKVPVTGDFRISGKVTDNGDGAHGFAVVLHNDPRGHLALAKTNAGGGSFGYDFGDDTKITKSVAFGVFNYYGYNGWVRFGTNGAWQKAEATSPKIITAPRGDSASGEPVQRQYDFVADFDAAAKTLTLVLSQEQGDVLAVSTNVLSNVDVPSLCGESEAYLALTSEAGGKTIDVTIDDFKIAYTHVPQAHARTRFFDTFAAESAEGLVTVAAMADDSFDLASSTSFAADARLAVANYGGNVALGTVAAAGSLALGSVPRKILVDASQELWENRLCKSDGTDADLGKSPYGERTGSIRTGYGITMNGSATGRKERIPVVGDFCVSGKVTDNGSGAHGFAVVLHNDPRGHLAHCTPSVGGDSLGFARFGDVTRIVNSVGVGIFNYAGYNGKVRLGKGGLWSGNHVATNPKIVTAPRGDNHQSTEVQRKYDFALAFNATAKTLTLVLSQAQGDVTAVSTNVFTNVDVPALCGDDKAYLTLTSEAGGCSVDVTIDDFKVVYSATPPAAFSTSSTIEAPPKSTLSLDNAILAANCDNAVVFDIFELAGSAAFAFDGNHRLSAVKVWRDDVRLPYATYTAQNCTWITGEGSVTARGLGLFLLVK